MPADVHDYVLVSYEVHCEARRIVLRTENREVIPVEATAIEFTGVQGYHFQHDAFGSIISELWESPLGPFLIEHRAEIQESLRQSGAGGTWACDADGGLAYLRGEGIRAFELLASIGLWGWVLATRATVRPAQGLAR